MTAMSDAMRERIARAFWGVNMCDATYDEAKAGAERGNTMDANALLFAQEVANAIIAALPDMVPKRQPIETAPKDGTEILGAWRYGGWSYQPMIWRNGWVKKFDATRLLRPTHWMPLPAAPKGGDGDE